MGQQVNTIHTLEWADYLVRHQLCCPDCGNLVAWVHAKPQRPTEHVVCMTAGCPRQDIIYAIPAFTCGGTRFK